MSQLNIHYQCLFLFIIFKIHLSVGKTCDNSIPDFFYYANFAGPIFDQSVYTTDPISVATANNTVLFTFTVKSRTNYTRPSFVPSYITGRAFRATPDNITVTSSHPDFTVVDLLNSVYSLKTNMTHLQYFSPSNRYLFKLIAKQIISDDRPPVTSTAIVQINLKNANVNRPVFHLNNTSFYISQANLPGTAFGTVYATDPDNDTITYSMCDAQFGIDRFTGVLRLERSLDSSSKSQYTVDVTITDDGSTCLSSHNLNSSHSNTESINITVIKVNKNPPRFTGQICDTNISIYENNSVGQFIAELCVWDDDEMDNQSITIEFPSEHLRTTDSGVRNTAYSQFYIDQLNQSGMVRRAHLKANKSFDYDSPGAPRVWYLFILATDSGEPKRQAFCSLRINLLDVNDNPPVFLMTSWNFTVTPSTTRFLRILAFDADSGSNGMINYYIGTLDVPYFTINRTTGEIILRNGASDISSFNISRFPIKFTVYAQDRGVKPLFSENNATVIIYYTNINVPSARWLNRMYEELNIEISEKFYETNTNQPIFDNNANFNGSIFFHLASNLTSIMTICSAFLDNKTIPFRDVPVVRDGQVHKSGIAVTRGLRADIQNRYLLLIRALVNPPLIGYVTVRLKDENDQTPTFDIRSIKLSVVEKESGTRSIARIQAFDYDVDYRNNFVQYRLNKALSEPEAEQLFYVCLNGTIWTNGTFNWTTKSLYRLFITAFDNATAWKSDTNETNTQDFQIEVEVININDNPPKFQNNEWMINILESTTIDTIIQNITVTDQDRFTKINLGILTGNQQNAFKFTLLSDNSDNESRTQYEAVGQLIVIAPLDYESKPNYTLVLFAFDAKNMASIKVTVNLIPENTKAPIFDVAPGMGSYIYEVTEGHSIVLNNIRAVDPDDPPTRTIYTIFSANHQLDLSNIELNTTGDSVSIFIKPPGLSGDLPFENSIYNFSINATDQNGQGLSSYTPVSIRVKDLNNNALIPVLVNGPWIINEGTNSSINITFKDFDDPQQNMTYPPYRFEVVSPSQFMPTCPTSSSDKICEFVYVGSLNRTSTKYLSVIIKTTDSQNVSNITSISILVGETFNNYPISDGYKEIKVIYVNGYENSLVNVDLGSIYVKDLNDWYRANRTYAIQSVKDGNRFNTSNEFLRASTILNPGSYTVVVHVTKPSASSTALGTIGIQVESIDGDYVRQASTIRIRGEYPETLIESTVDPPINKLRRALSSLLSVTVHSIKILTIRPVFQYRSLYYIPKPFDEDKNETLTDVIFYIPGSARFNVEKTLKSSQPQFLSRFGINVTTIAPNPCDNYRCPTSTTCQPTRTIQPKPFAIDTNQTSFVGINILDSADCVNLTPILNGCNPFNDASYCSSFSFGRIFDGIGDRYAEYHGTTFSNFAPSRFSFDFVLQKSISAGLILLYGRTEPPINDFFWTAIEIFESKLRFHFRETKIFANDTPINAGTWYHVEYQFVDSMILVSVNDCQYHASNINDTLNTYNLSSVELFLGGLPSSNVVVSGLYSSLTTVNTFNGCIRNVISNGYYLDMAKTLSSANSKPGECPCSITNSCRAKERASIIPWYTWLILALVFLFLVTVFLLTLMMLIRRRQQLKTLTALYTDDARDNIIDYKESAGEEDHSTYNLQVLKKPVYTIPIHKESDYRDSWDYHRPSLDVYIGQKLNEQVVTYSDDTQLRYKFEGDGSVTSELSSIEASPLHIENTYTFIHSLGPKFSPIADLYTDHDV